MAGEDSEGVWRNGRRDSTVNIGCCMEKRLTTRKKLSLDTGYLVMSADDGYEEEHRILK